MLAELAKAGRVSTFATDGEFFNDGAHSKPVAVAFAWAGLDVAVRDRWLDAGAGYASAMDLSHGDHRETWTLAMDAQSSDAQLQIIFRALTQGLQMAGSPLKAYAKGDTLLMIALLGPQEEHLATQAGLSPVSDAPT